MQYTCASYTESIVCTVVPTKIDRDVILCLQLLSKTLTCSIDSFHIVSAHAPNCLVPRYLREITLVGATFIRLPYTLHNGKWKR